jgi:crotonobetainyl-CoA:carnitine CoA-transferase CaiB-like acyl-CoA transferase
MYDALVSLMTMRVVDYVVTGVLIERGEKRGSAPNGLFKVKDGYVAIGVVGEQLWSRFCHAIGRPELVNHPGLETGSERARNVETKLRPLIEHWAADKTKQEVTEILLSHHVPAGPVQTLPEVVECPHIKSRQMLVEAEHPVVGHTKYVGNPIKMSDYPNPIFTPPPLLGEHTEQVLSSILGMTSAEMLQLQAEGVV